MDPQTPVSEPRSDAGEGVQYRSKSTDYLYSEAKPKSADTAPGSPTTEQEPLSVESEQQGQKRKRRREDPRVKQEHCTKRARRAVAQRTHLTASALKTVQDEQEHVVDRKDSQAS